MKIGTEEYNLFIKRLSELGIEQIDFLEPDFLRNFQISDIVTFDKNQLQDFLDIIKEKEIELRTYVICCNTSDNLEEQIDKIKLIQQTMGRGKILIGGNLSDKVIIDRIDVYDEGVEESEIGTGYYEPYVSIEELEYIGKTIQEDKYEKNEVLQITNKYNTGTGEEETIYKRGILLIDNITQLNKEEALKIKGNGKINAIAVKNSDGPDKYDLDTYIKILDAFQELTGDIDKNLSDETKFEMIYRRICESIQYEKDMKECYTLEGGLLNKKSACRGYSVILRNALISYGIDCECISGYASGGHAWNKVKINGEWFNVDATWDRPDIIAGMQPSHALKSDKHIQQYDKKREFKGPECLRNATQEEINKIFPLDRYKNDELLSYYEMYPQYQETVLGREIIQLMLESTENDAEILNWDKNILEHGTNIDIIKQEILRINPTWEKYRQTEVGAAVMKFLERGLTEQQILKLDKNYYFDENGIDIETIKNEIRERIRQQSKSTKDLGKETLEEQKDIALLDEIEQVQTRQERDLKEKMER